MMSFGITNAFLASHSMFGGLDERELDMVKTYLKGSTYPSGAMLLRQGEPNNSVYFIVEGTVSVVRKSETMDLASREIATLTKGDSFGEMELIEINNCAASIITLTETSIVTLSNHDLYQIFQQSLHTYTMLVLNLARDISRRLRSADEMLALINVH
jgi:CRP/FNR family cyclic AMP-dependent transcriptional regulator